MRLRAPTIDDAPAVLEVLVGREIVDLGVADYVLADLLDEWRASELDLAADARLVECDGRIVAYAMVRGPGTLVAVAPEYEDRGVGARLLKWAEGRERELGRPQHRQWIGSRNERAKTLLQAAGYELALSYWRMALRLEGGRDRPHLVPRPHPAPRPHLAPQGLRLRSLAVEKDAVALHALDAASFAGAPDYQPESLQAFREEHLAAHDLDAQLSRVAELSGRIVGFLLARRWTEASVGFVDILAVDPDHQRQGIGTALLVDAFERFRAAGLEEAQLGVASTNRRALRLYEGLGMTPRFRFDTYERPLSRTDQPPPTPSNPGSPNTPHRP